MSQSIVRKVDHVILRTDDARSLFNKFTADLGLPVAWPLFHYMGCLSGAVGLGRVSLEFLQPLPGCDSKIRELLQPGTRLVGLALEPTDVAPAVAALDARGLGHAPPTSYLNADQRRWTNVHLDYWVESPIRLLVKYDRDQDARWDVLERALATTQGGALGVRALAEVTIGVRDFDEATRRWCALLDAGDAQGVQPWRPAHGPALRLERRAQDGLASLVVAVRDLETARVALREHGMIADDSSTEISVRLATNQDVAFLISEA